MAHKDFGKHILFNSQDYNLDHIHDTLMLMNKVATISIISGRGKCHYKFLNKDENMLRSLSRSIRIFDNVEYDENVNTYRCTIHDRIYNLFKISIHNHEQNKKFIHKFIRNQLSDKYMIVYFQQIKKSKYNIIVYEFYLKNDKIIVDFFDYTFITNLVIQD